MTRRMFLKGFAAVAAAALVVQPMPAETQPKTPPKWNRRITKWTRRGDQAQADAYKAHQVARYNKWLKS